MENNRIKRLSQLIQESLDENQSNRDLIIQMAEVFESRLKDNLLLDPQALEKKYPDFSENEWLYFLNDSKVTIYLDLFTRTFSGIEERNTLIRLNNQLLEGKIVPTTLNWFKNNWTEWNKNSQTLLSGNRVIYMFKPYEVEGKFKKEFKKTYSKFRLILTDKRTNEKFYIIKGNFGQWQKHSENCYIFEDNEESHKKVLNEVENIKIMFSVVGTISKEEF